MESEESSMVPKQCTKGCGFCGSAWRDNVCSQCYMDFRQEEYQNHNPIQKLLISTLPNSSFIFLDPNLVSRVNNNNTGNSNNRSACFTFGSTNNSGGAAFISNARNICNSCNKRVGLTGFNCPCGNVFCGKHRYPQEHECCVDFKALGREALFKENPICKADKLQFRI